MRRALRGCARGLTPHLAPARHRERAARRRQPGLDSKIISAIIGQSTVVITQDRYTHVDRSHLADAAAQLDSYLAQTG